MSGNHFRVALAGALFIATQTQAIAAERSPDAIIADYEQAIGGSVAWGRHRSVHTQRELASEAMQLRGTEEQFQVASGKAISITTLPGLGTFRQGSTGSARWSEDPINGLRILQGAEDEQMKIESTWNAELQLKKLFPTIRTVPAPAPAKAGQSYECVELTARQTHPMVMCFDSQTHLQVLRKGQQATPQGDVPYTVTFSDWRDVGDVKIPFAQEQTTGPMTMTLRTLDVVFDKPIADSVFQMPRTRPVAGKARAKN